MSLTGNWTGMIRYTLNGTGGQQNLSMTLQQTGTAVTGTYLPTSVGYFSATGSRSITGTTAPTFTGTFSFSPSSNPNGCAGTFDVAATGSSIGLVWTSTGISSTCGTNTPSDVTVTASR
jgi:hypothetical protein